MLDYSRGNPAPWKKYSEYVDSIYILQGITSVGNFAFEGFDNVTEVSFRGDSVTKIGDSAFHGCIKLESIFIGNSVWRIGERAFYECESLSFVDVGDGVESIGYYAFNNCKNMTDIYIGDSVRFIDSGAFNGCENIETVTISNLKAWCGIEFVNQASNPLHEGAALSELGDPYDELVIPDGITTIKSYAFWGCSNVLSVIIPDSVRKIESGSLRECSSLVNVTIGNGVTSIEDRAFWFSTKLKHVLYKGTKNQWDAIQKGEYTSEITEAIIHYAASGDEVYWRGPEEYKSLCCTVCDKVLMQGCIHEEPELRDEIVPTCTKDGYTGDLYCANCGELIENGRNIDALGHQYEDGSCIRCGEIYNPFGDVSESSYYYDPVLWAVQKGITNGTTPTTFSPYDPCTRGQIVTFLWRAFGSPEPEKDENPFTDVPENMYYYKAILWAVEQGITTGTSATTFSPEDTCTRGQVATFLWRACGKPEPQGSENPFTDVPETVYYYEPILWAVENGITNGTGNGKFSPEDSCTRGQIVTFLYRALAK